MAWESVCECQNKEVGDLRRGVKLCQKHVNLELLLLDVLGDAKLALEPFGKKREWSLVSSVQKFSFVKPFPVSSCS